MSDSNPFDSPDNLSFLEVFGDSEVPPAQDTTASSVKTSNSDYANKQYASETKSKILRLNSPLFYTLGGFLFIFSLLAGIFLGQSLNRDSNALLNLAHSDSAPPTIELSDKENCFTWPGGIEKSMQNGVVNTPFGLVASMENAFYVKRSGKDTATYLTVDFKQHVNETTNATLLQRDIDANIPIGTSYCLLKKSATDHKVQAELRVFKPNKPAEIITKTYLLKTEAGTRKISKIIATNRY